MYKFFKHGQSMIYWLILMLKNRTFNNKLMVDKGTIAVWTNWNVWNFPQWNLQLNIWSIHYVCHHIIFVIIWGVLSSSSIEGSLFTWCLLQDFTVMVSNRIFTCLLHSGMHVILYFISSLLFVPVNGLCRAMYYSDTNTRGHLWWSSSETFKI